jgi:shikimate dehydrogenase
VSEGNHPFRVGLLGAKLGHSRSPEIHAILFRLHGMNGSYDLLERNPEELEGLLPALRAQGYRGINVTIPYKTHMMRHLDALSPEALRIGAVNTIVIGAKNVGHNTDYAGFGHLVESMLARTGATQETAVAKAAVLGTGGSSRAVIAWLEDHGVQEITLVSRDPDEASMKWPGLHAIGYDAFHAAGCDLVVNTTPVGMFPHPDASPLDPEQLRGAGCVIDLIYNPLETRLMKDAAKYGIPCANGLRMLVAQAVEAHSIWHGIPYDGKDADAILAAMTGGVAGT